MSDVEMNTAERPNRFQVNPVKKGENSEQQYRRIADSDGGETQDDDNFPVDIRPKVQRKSSARLSVSFRKEERPSKYGDVQTTKFQSITGESDSSDDTDRENLLEDTKYGRSFRHFTREALPRLDNYRNILSINAANRPTLDDLHNATIINKSQSLKRTDSEATETPVQMKFGWIQGVLVRCLLNIWGVMLFLRLSWLTGQSGIIEGIILISTATIVSTITALSMSAISTNGVIKGGGSYYMISRSLGPEWGGSIGLIFSLANAVAVAMYVVGFCESMNTLLKSNGLRIIDNDTNDVRIIGCATILILTVIVVVGMEWEAKAQIGLLIILLIAIVDFLIGSFIGPKDDTERAQGFLGYNATIFKQNLYTDYRRDEGVDHDFFSVFAIFFPAATGFLAGANISGDLKDPQVAIPKGTLLAILLSTVTYFVMVMVAGATVARDATGNVTDMINGSWAFLDCEKNEECEYGLQNSFDVIKLVSAFGPIIYAGCFAATLSSALASLVSAPKVFQALCKDELYPKIKWFARGYGKNNEPVRGYILTFVISVAFILIGQLNAIAPLISNFFLAAYMLINFSTFHASLAKPVGWRPTFKYYNMWLSLLGSILCVAVMLLISWVTALLTFAVVIILYLVVLFQKPDVNWGSTTQAQTYKNALLSVQQLNNVEEHVKNYRPQIIVMSGLPNSRPILIDFANLLSKNLSLLICGHAINGNLSQAHRYYLRKRAGEWFDQHKVKAFYSLIDGEDFETATKALMQASGLGKLKPNILLMGYKRDWQTCNRSELDQYFNTMHKALDIHLAVALLRIDKGFDYSDVLGDAVQLNKFESANILQSNDSSADLFAVDKNHPILGSCDSLSRNASQDITYKPNGTKKTKFKTSSTSDLSIQMPNKVSIGIQVSELPDPVDDKSNLNNYLQRGKKRRKESTAQYCGPNGDNLPKHIIQELTIFSRRHTNAVIDVYWLYDDGGLTLLLPYIISTRRNWRSCKLRVFALANKKAEIECELNTMASLLAKFRIDYSDLQLLPDVTKKPTDETMKFFHQLISGFLATNDNEEDNKKTDRITESDLMAVRDKTNRHLRLREYLLEHSQNSNLIVMTLPMPRKNIVSAPLYMAWLECLSRNLPPFLFVRGNQTSVLTFYS